MHTWVGWGGESRIQCSHAKQCRGVGNRIGTFSRESNALTTWPHWTSLFVFAQFYELPHNLFILFYLFIYFHLFIYFFLSRPIWLFFFSKLAHVKNEKKKCFSYQSENLIKRLSHYDISATRLLAVGYIFFWLAYYTKFNYAINKTSF